MHRLIFCILSAIIILGCKDQIKEKEAIPVKLMFNQQLADELVAMVEIDQLAANNAFPPQGYSHLTQEQWEHFKDSVYRLHEKRAQEMFDTHGFLGHEIVGKAGSSNFWLLVQHADHNPDFQNEVLEKMEVEVANNNADSRDYGLLVDRVKLNTGQAQVYGTQVQYNKHTGQAYPKRLIDSINVNERRKSVGLYPIEEYLNDMTEMHFEMNKANMLERGITAPKLYETPIKKTTQE